MIHTCGDDDCLHVNQQQIDTIKWIARGKSNREIARLMGRSVQTVKNRLVPLFDELGVASRTGLVVAAMRAGLVSLEDL